MSTWMTDNDDVDLRFSFRHHNQIQMNDQPTTGFRIVSGSFPDHSKKGERVNSMNQDYFSNYRIYFQISKLPEYMIPDRFRIMTAV